MRSRGTDESYRARWLGFVKRIKRQQPNLQTDVDISKAIIDLIVSNRSQLLKPSFRQYRQAALYGLSIAIGIDETLRLELQDQLYESGDYKQIERPLATSSQKAKNFSDQDWHRLCAFLGGSKIASDALLLNFLRARAFSA